MLRTAHIDKKSPDFVPLGKISNIDKLYLEFAGIRNWDLSPKIKK